MTRNAIALAFLFSHAVAQAYHADPNIPGPLLDQIKSDLEFIGQVQGVEQSRIHQQVFGQLSGRAYHQFFEDRITDLGLDEKSESHAVAYVRPVTEPSKLWLTHNYVKFNHPQIARLL